MSISRGLIAKAILIIIVVTALPVAILLLLHPQDHPLDNLVLGFQLGVYVTLPPGISLAATCLLAKSYLAQCKGSILTFGSAMLMWGLANMAIIVFIFVAPSLNPGWAVASVGFLLSSLLHFSGAFPSIGGLSSKSSARFRLALAYVSVTVAAAVLSYAAYDGLTLSSFAIGGGTLLDISFTSASIILFSASSILFLKKTEPNAKSLFQYWYSAGLAIFAITSIPSFWGQSGIDRAGFLNAAGILGGCLCFFIAAFVCLEENTHVKK